MNILFVTYDNFNNNSAIQIHTIANALAEAGNQCFVSVPNDKYTAKRFIGGKIGYTPCEYGETLHPSFSFQDGKHPDIIHAWTPREIVRKQCVLLRKRFPSARLIVHLEDNEEAIVESNTGLPIEIICSFPDEKIVDIIPDIFSHPLRYRDFLSNANGITVIIDTLFRFVPEGKPALVVFPVIDMYRFCSQPVNQAMRNGLGIGDEEIVVCYNGNVHNANLREVKSLYLAVALANREHLPVSLVRTGINHRNPLDGLDKATQSHFIELGFIEYGAIPACLAMADVLIQPGNVGEFNDYRLPSKIPEFLAMGKPVAVPETNIGRLLKNEEEAMLMSKGNALDILEVIFRISNDKDLAKRLSEGSRKFAERHFSKEKILSRLIKFYEKILKS
ncbi:MAG: hypothetical protein JXA35_11460 [Deltaproteobacteria bacterium]|nr:hypothetical protein [Deltaproteobacteria bacterium]